MEGYYPVLSRDVCRKLVRTVVVTGWIRIGELLIQAGRTAAETNIVTLLRLREYLRFIVVHMPGPVSIYRAML